MDEAVKQRVVGASVLAGLAVLLVPWLFGDPKDPRSGIRSSFDGTPIPQATAAPRPVAVAPTPVAVPTATATPAIAAAPRWILQLASYRDAKSAEAFLDRLEKDGYAAYQESVEISGQRYRRVRVAMEGSRQDAVALQRKLEKRYRLTAKLLAAN